MRTHISFFIISGIQPPSFAGGLNASPERSHVLTWRSGGNNPDVSPISGRYSGFSQNTP